MIALTGFADNVVITDTAEAPGLADDAANAGITEAPRLADDVANTGAAGARDSAAGDIGATRALGLALEPAEVRRLVSIGFHALLNGKPAAAQRLFDALSVVRPDATVPRIGCALALVQRGRAEEAVKVLEEVLRRCPDDEHVRVFLGMSLRLANRGSQAGAVLAPLAQRAGDSAGTRFARQLLNLAL